MERYNKVKQASILGILGNLFLLIIKGIIALMTSSHAMIADTFNSAGDILSSIMTYIGNKVSSIPSDEDHNLGHGKAEYIYSLLISVLMILTSLKILLDSVLSLINGDSYTFSYLLIIVCIITIIVKLLLYLYTNRLSKTYSNLLLKANSLDHRNDCILTTLSLFSSLLALKGIYFFDSIVGIGISLWIIYSALFIFKDSYDVLMDKTISEDVKDKVLDIIKRHQEIKKIIHFNATPVGYRYQISFTIYVDGNMSTFESHDIADTLEKEIDSELDEIYLTVIHVNPYGKRKRSVKTK